MTLEKFYKMVVFAKHIGINTIGELAAYKERNKIKTNDELYDSLYRDDFILNKQTAV